MAELIWSFNTPGLGRLLQDFLQLSFVLFLGNWDECVPYVLCQGRNVEAHIPRVMTGQDTYLLLLLPSLFWNFYEEQRALFIKQRIIFTLAKWEHQWNECQLTSLLWNSNIRPDVYVKYPNKLKYFYILSYLPCLFPKSNFFFFAISKNIWESSFQKCSPIPSESFLIIKWRYTAIFGPDKWGMEGRRWGLLWVGLSAGGMSGAPAGPVCQLGPWAKDLPQAVDREGVAEVPWPVGWLLQLEGAKGGRKFHSAV